MKKFLLGLLAAVAGVGSAQAEFLVGLRPGNSLYTYDSAAPGAGTNASLTGLNAGDTLIGIDYRPFDGQLVGVGVNSSTGVGTAYSINPYTGTAARLNANPIPYGAGATNYGVDFNPTAGPSNALRLISNGAAPNNFRLPGGAMAGVVTDTALNGANTNVVATAYTNNTAAPVVGPTTMYTITDLGAGAFALNTQGGLNSVPSPNTGTQNLVAAISGLGLGEVVNGLDISGANGTAYLSTLSGLYTLNLSTGAATSLGAFGFGDSLGVTAVPANGNPVPAPAAYLAFAIGSVFITSLARRRANSK